MSKQGYSSGKGSHSNGKKQSKSDHVDQLTNEQISDFQEAFRVFDRDGSGQISCKELGLVLRSLGQNPTETELQDKVNEIDTDGSGMIEFPEFLNMMAESAHQDDPEAGIREAFWVFDHNSQGFVTCDEMRFVLTNLQGALNDAEISAMLRRSDHNSDGHITYDEFARMMTRGWRQPHASTAPADRP